MPARQLASLVRRIMPLARLASEYATAQVVGRVLAATSALILVRALSVSEYGYYTLFLTAFTFICTFSDLGVTETLSYFRWRAGARQRPWVHYMHAVLSFRRIVFALGLLGSGIYLFYVGGRIGRTPLVGVVAVAIMGFSAWFAIQSGVLTYVLKLQQRFREAYAIEISNEATKLLVVVSIWLAGLVSACAGMASVAAGAVVSATLATYLQSRQGVIAKPSSRQAYQRSRMVLRQITPVLPGTIHFTLQGPLIAWIAAHYGSVANLAEVGAVGRIAVIIGALSGFTSAVFLPRLLSINNEGIFRKRYLQWWLVTLAYGGLMLLLIFTFPQPLLWLLGQSYESLNTELVTASATAVVATWGAYSWNVNRARGWTKYQPYRVPVMVIGQLGLFLTLDLATTQGVLLFAFWSIALDVCFQTLISVFGLAASNVTMKSAHHA
jgi:O-antigen/teichoic acid export membrane protein